jgi:hypothetical protein
VVALHHVSMRQGFWNDAYRASPYAARCTSGSSIRSLAWCGGALLCLHWCVALLWNGL